MKFLVREDPSGVSEVVGTILILAMTVVLFSSIILWVSNIPTPVAQTRVDIQGSLNPVFGANGLEAKDYINLTHQGGESLAAASTQIYISDQRGNAAPTTSVLRLAPYKNLGAVGYGLLDGSGASWSVGQRFSYMNTSMRSSDKVTVTIVDTFRSIVLWTSTLTPPAGQRPPIFLSTYAAQNNVGTALPVQTGSHFYIFAQILAPDNNLNPNSVFATITYYYGSASCAQPLQMYDDGRLNADGDVVASDGIFTLYRNDCTATAVSGMDGSIVLFNATDMNGHQTTTRMILHVVPGTTSGTSGGGLGGSGRPPNLRWNGEQGYNIFNATEWDKNGYAAVPTRNFHGSDTVVLVVGSLTLLNVYGVNQFNMLDPYSGSPAQAVVYGSAKTVGPASQPSTTAAFSFFQFVNGYYVYTYRFELNDPATVGTNYYATPPAYPRYYYFASYPLSVLLTDSKGDRFTTADTVNITADNGGMRSFPAISTFLDPYYTHPGTTFRSTDTIYVQVRTLTVDTNTTSGMANVYFGNVMIQDFGGGQEVNRAPTSGIYSNLPICPAVGSCSSTNRAIWSSATVVAYRFAINLARANQDPWVAGTQNYTLILSQFKDSDESYSGTSLQITVKAPLYKMDIVTGNQGAGQSAWGSNDFAYFYQNYNGYDVWRKLRVDYCAPGTGVSISGVPGNGVNCPVTNDVLVAFGDFWSDGTLGIAESILANSNAVEIYRRAVDATGAVTYIPVFHNVPPTACTAITTGDVTGDGQPDIVCGGANGYVWYYANNGNWTTVYVDQPSSGSQINAIAVGDFNGDGWNDIATGTSAGVVKWYPNLGYGRFQSTSISDNWYPQGEQIVKGTIVSGSYLNLYAQDGIYEQLNESLLTVPQQVGTNPNYNFNSNANWTSGTITSPVTLAYQSSGGNPGGWVSVSTSGATNSVPAGYWQVPFTVAGSQPFTANLTLNYRVSQYGATGAPWVTFRAVVDPSAGTPNTANTVWTTSISSTKVWTNVSGIPVAGSLIPSPGTYYLKLAVYVTCGTTACGTTTAGYDNAMLLWSSTPGSTSALEEYWRLPQLPTRPNTAFVLTLRGHQSTSSEDNFVFAYATNVVNNDPTTGTYTNMFTLTATSDTTYSFTFSPASLVSGKVVWVRVLDTNRVVGNAGLENLYLDLLYVNANTASGTTGVTLSADGTAINALDAGNQNADAYSDLVVGTAGGKVYEYLGSGGGLLQPGSYLYNAGSAIVGLAYGNFSTSFPGLEIALAFGSTVRIIRGDTGAVITNALTPYLTYFASAGTITGFAVGDVNGDGWDDVVVGTSGGYLFLWANLGQGTTWTIPNWYVDSTGAAVYSIALGDSTNAAYMGR